jgi:hypothetical protein
MIPLSLGQALRRLAVTAFHSALPIILAAVIVFAFFGGLYFAALYFLPDLGPLGGGP